MYNNLKKLLFDRKDQTHTLPPNSIVLKGVQPNYGIESNYRKVLTKLVRQMMSDVIPAIMNAYKSHHDEITNIVGDSLIYDSIIEEIYSLITVKMGYWQTQFELIANPLATEVVNSVNKNVNYQFIKNLKPISDVSFKSIVDNFKINISEETKRIVLAKEASIKENVSLITNIGPKAEQQIHTAVMAASSRGRDAAYLRAELMKIDGMTINRAQTIARDQLNKVTSVLHTAKQANLGIKESRWRHSNAGKEPRKSHVEASGKVYPNDKGCLIDGEYIYPGQKINCRCYCESIITFDIPK